MAYACPYCNSKSVKNFFDDDVSLRRHMSVCSNHPHSKFVTEYNEEASIGAVVIFLGLVFAVSLGFFVWVFW